MRATQRQAQILNALREAVIEDGEAPTVRQFADAVGLSSASTVVHHLRRMEEQGLVRRTGHRRGCYLPAR
ncbi:LexA family protein [Streptomyces mayteni]